MNNGCLHPKTQHLSEIGSGFCDIVFVMELEGIWFGGVVDDRGW